MTMMTPSKRSADLVEKGKEALQHHHLRDAENLFLAALQTLPPEATTPGDTTTLRDRNLNPTKGTTNRDPTDQTLAFEACHGLAQTYSKKGRYCRSDEREWHRYYLQALYMYRQAAQLAPAEDASKIKDELKPVQEIYCQCLEARLFPAPPPSRVNRNKAKVVPKMNEKWLEELKGHIREKLVVAQSSRDSVSSSDSSVLEEPIQVPQEEPHKKRIDFNRVRNAIMRMVKVISTDMRSRYIRKKLSQETLKQAVSSEMLCMLTPENENMDVVSLFESYICEEEPEFETEQGASTSNADQTTLCSTESESDERSTRTSSVDKDVPRHMVTPLYSCRESYAVPRIYHHINSARQSVNSDVRLNGILRVWRGHNQDSPRPSSKFVPHKMNFEECSPLTENTNYSFQDTQAPSENVISEQNIEITLAALLAKIADKFSANNEFVAADEVYTYALGIYQRHKDNMPSQEGKAVAHLLNSIGKVRCRKGDMIGGAHLMEKSVDLYRRFHGEEDHVDIINVWFELGRAFLYEQCQEDSLLDYVMKTVKSRVDLTTKKSKKLEEEDPMDYVSDSEDSDDESEDSYLLNIHEAKLCFSHALRMLRNLRRNRNEMHNGMYVEVLSKLADCCVMLGDYQRATLCYEEALVLFRNVLGSKSVLPLNAHVLTMLGVTNFLVGSYPKAVTMLETAHILHQHMTDREVTVDKAFTLTMLGITNHIAGQYYKCVAWCLKAHEMYLELFPNLAKVSWLQVWFVVQNVYMLGFAYSYLALNDQALLYLELSHDMAHTALAGNEGAEDSAAQTEQIVHIIKLIADVYVALDQPSEALKFYQKAHDYSVRLGDDQRSNTLHNQLLNCMAGLHISSKNYNTAAECLEQALDYQENLQDSIKGDMFGMLHSLGLTYTFSGDLDKAVSCYKEAIETYHEDLNGGGAGPEIAGILGRLATLFHVKMCLEEDESHEADLCEQAERYYHESTHLDPCSPVVVQFANFQYQQSQTPEALLSMIDFLRRSTVPSTGEVVYNGPEQAVLPSHLQFDVDEVDEVVLNAKIFGHFLAILCYKELHLMKDAEDCLVELLRLVYQTSEALNFSILGYGLMELELLEEAAYAFHLACHFDPESSNSVMNVWLCLAAAAYRALLRAVHHVIEHAYLPFKAPPLPKLAIAQVTQQESTQKPLKVPETVRQDSKTSVVKDTVQESFERKVTKQDTVSTVKDAGNLRQDTIVDTDAKILKQETPLIIRDVSISSKTINQSSSQNKLNVKDSPGSRQPRDLNNSQRVEFESVVVFNYSSPKPMDVHLNAVESKPESTKHQNSKPSTETKKSVPNHHKSTERVYKQSEFSSVHTWSKPKTPEQKVSSTSLQPPKHNTETKQTVETKQKSDFSSIHNWPRTKTSEQQVSSTNLQASRHSTETKQSVQKSDQDQQKSEFSSIHNWPRRKTPEQQVSSHNLQPPRQTFGRTQNEVRTYADKSVRSVVAMDISPDEAPKSHQEWSDHRETSEPLFDEEEDDGPNAEVLDEMLKSSEEIEAELHDVLRHIDAVQNKTTPKTSTPRKDSDWRSGGLSYDWRTGRYSNDTANGNNKESESERKNGNGKSVSRTGGVSYDWRTGKRINKDADADADAANSNGKSTDSDWRTGGVSYDWRTGRYSSRSSVERSEESNNKDKDGWRAEKDLSWRKSPEPETNPPPVSGWRAATSTRTQEILMSIQNNNLARKKMEETPEPQEQEEEQWQVWEEEEVVETPPEILAAILAAQKGAA